MNYIILGSGLMGGALAYDLVRSPGVTSVTLADADEGRAVEAARRIGSDVVRPLRLDVEY